MTPTEEARFLTNFASAMNRSRDGRELEKLWADYSGQISECSAAGQKRLHGLRAKRSCELMEKK